MKKVVLLAGALAMGMASAPMAANAANPAVNDVQGVNLTSSQIQTVLNEARVLQAQYHSVMGHSQFTNETVVPAESQKLIVKAYNHVTSLIEEGESLIDGNINASTIFYATSLVGTQGAFKSNPYAAGMPEWVTDYKGLTNKNTIADLLEKQTVAYSAIYSAVAGNLSTYESNVEHVHHLNAQLDAFQATVSAFELNEEALYADDYADLDEKLAALNDAIDAARAEIAATPIMEVGEYELPAQLAADLAAFKVALKNAENLLAANKEAKAKVESTLGDILATLNGVVLNPETLYEDDYDALFEKLDELRELVYTAQEDIKEEFAKKTAKDYQVDGELNVKLVELLGAKLEAENLLAANKEAKAEKLAEIAHLEVLLQAVNLDEHHVYGEDLKALQERVDAIKDMIDAARAGLAEAFDNKKADDFNVGNTIFAAIEELKKAACDYEKFKAENLAAAVQVYNDYTNVLVALEALKSYGEMYEEGVLGNYDKASIDRWIANLVLSANTQLSYLQGDVLDGKVTYYLAETVEELARIKGEIAELQEAIKVAEKIYADNVEGKNYLLGYWQTLRTAISTTVAVTKCEVCDPEYTGTLSDLYEDLYEVEDLINAAFADKKIAKEAAGSEFQALYIKLYEYELKLAEIKASIEKTNDEVVFSQKACENFLDKMLDVHFWTTQAQVKGYESFLKHNDHCCNPDVLYFDQIQALVDELKEEVIYDNSHEGGHQAFANYNSYVKRLLDIKEKLEVLKAAIEANEAAKALIDERYAELYADALDAYNFWHKYYASNTLIAKEPIANYKWIKEREGVLEAGNWLVVFKNYFEDLYNNGAAAYQCTVDAQGKELNDAANNMFDEQDADLANDRNVLAYVEATDHAAFVTGQIATYQQNIINDFSVEEDGYLSWDPFVYQWKDGKFVGVMVDWLNDVEGEYGLINSLNLYKQDIEAAYEEGVLEEALNIDLHNTALGIHQQLDGVEGVLEQIKAEYEPLFEAAHHLTNGKTIYSDQEYFTLGFFQKANEGLGNQAQEMFNWVAVNDMEAINVLDLTAYESETTYDDPTDFDSPYTVVYAKDEDGNLIRWNDGYATEVETLVHGYKANELSFNIPQNMAPLAVTTLLAGPACVEFLPGSITVDEWTTKHTVTIGFNVAEPVVEESVDTNAQPEGDTVVVRPEFPVDLTYTSKVLVATTNAGEQISFADAQFDVANGQIKFALPAGTQSIEFPEGFFTFRTGENSIARSAAMVVAVGGTQTSIDALIAMGEKAQVFDLQGRRVNVETLVKGNTYVVNGVKTIVK